MTEVETEREREREGGRKKLSRLKIKMKKMSYDVNNFVYLFLVSWSVAAEAPAMNKKERKKNTDKFDVIQATSTSTTSNQPTSLARTQHTADRERGNGLNVHWIPKTFALYTISKQPFKRILTSI